MIRAIRPNAMAQDDATMLAGWNVAPNLAYMLRLVAGPSAVGVFLYDADSKVLIASGAALVGTGQPCILTPQSGQTVGMVDADLGWHIMVTATGAESPRDIRIGPAVDLPDEIHPVYGEDGLALAKATAAINAAAHYIDDLSVTCPLGLGAGLGDVVSVPVDGSAVVGQVESITWTATPDGTIEQAVIRRHVAIAPEPVVEPEPAVPPTVADDTGTATNVSGASGNVLSNDEPGLTVVAVAGLSANIGKTVAGDNGGLFTIDANGAWSFDPGADFNLLGATEAADTSVTYHASDGTVEAMATLTVTVSRANAAPVAVNDTGETDAETTTSGNVLTNDTDADEDDLSVSQVAGSASNIGVAVAGSNGGLFTIDANGAWSFDPNDDFSALTGEQTATTSVTYHVSDGMAEDEGTLTVTVSAPVATGDPLWDDVVLLIQAPESGSTIADAKGATITGQGGIAVSTALGYPTILFDGTDDRLDVGAAGDYNLLHDGTSWTLELIFYPTRASVDNPIIDTCRGSLSSVGIYLAFASNNKLQLFISNGADGVIGSTVVSSRTFDYAFSLNTEYNVALEIDISAGSNAAKLYVEGIHVASLPRQTQNNPSNANHQQMMVGMFHASYPSYSLQGHVRALRITSGLRYGNDFTPQTWPWPTS